MDTQGIWYFEDKNFSNFFCMPKVRKMEYELAQKEKGFNKGDFVYFIDDPSDNVYLIKQGRVKISTYADDGKEIVKTILSAGEVFGELALTEEIKRNDFAQVLDPNTIICPLTIKDMKNLMADDQELSFTIFKIIGLRMRKLERRIELLISKDARTRIIEFLKDLAREKGKKVGFETMIKSHLKHQDIASLTGTSRQTVTTILNELKEKNLINFDRRKILIRDIDKLV
ncbi:CRP/FNR family cyclic AMP-dependent transcriptional regulator [Catalinimonas alkaloidigena]|uniref:Crp/Fnr family transcriptional regulator n=1 Tax=Catalinimonas alkaloidigena TaxID=1075417 RepID=UPI00240653CF|nr:Crp/Fnr family transcriptional regulator [Catalinimonas alkaloidigena]MDF9800914.1 CRP/FNR family cyclic AMP-dependent transcriptional regulator [Catalinimonas alkaloidigena]